ncbi:MAG: radical SAM protein [Patescibacteria group bacterium]|nr:radical SAM protein [Patescibacteria group bacterium]
MKRNFWFILAAIVCLTINLVMPLFAGYNTSAVQFLIYGYGFQTGPTILHVLSEKGYETNIEVELTKVDDKNFILTCKGAIPDGFTWLDRNRATNLSDRYESEQEGVNLPDIPRKNKDNTKQIIIAISSALTQNDFSKRRSIFPHQINPICPGKEQVPNNFVNDVDGWSFSKEYLAQNTGKLLTLDLDFGEYCSLNCPHCFRRNGAVNRSSNPCLLPIEILYLINSQAQELGLESIKILGAGEPFEDKYFLIFLEQLKSLGIKVNIFTKAHVLGDDALANKYFNLSARELVSVIKDLGVSLNVGFNSFDPALQDEMVGVQGYTEKRNRALELLAEAGFNQGQPTRLCLAIVPITKQNIHEIYDIYVFARERNIYPVTTVSMCAGRARESWKDLTPREEELIALYTRINIYNIEKGVNTLKELSENGVSAYAGGHPCNQVACGMYITSRGIVLRCPGDDVTVFSEDVRKESLADIWHRSENYARHGMFNCHCPPKDGKSIPQCLYQEVLSRVQKHFT